MKMGGIQNNLCEIQSIGDETRELLIYPGTSEAFARHGIRLAGISYTTSDFRFVRPSPNMAQYLICFRGTGRVLCDGVWMTCRPGQAYLTPAWQLHAYQGRRGWEIGWITVEPEAATIERPIMREVNPAPFERILLGLHEENSTSPNSAAIGLWVDLLHHYCEQIAGPGHSSRLWKLWQQVRQDIGAPWTLESLARTAGIGTETLRLICLRENSRSPMAHLRRLRMYHAVSLLKMNQKVEFVSRAVGYENSYAFSTAFKREMGRPPSAFQKGSLSE